MKITKWTILALLLFILFLLLGYISLLTQRPAGNNTTNNLYSGISYSKIIHTSPRPIIYHILKIDMDTPGISFMVTPFDRHQPQNHLYARTTSGFISEIGVQAAVNGSFFRPFKENTPWDYYPEKNDPVSAIGFVASNQIIFNQTNTDLPSLCIEDDHISIENTGCSNKVHHAISGDIIFVQDGKIISSDDSYHTKPYPRTSLAVDQKNDTLWIIVADGKQHGYSESVTLNELGKFILELGANLAINLDGGGSSTLGIQEESGPKILNSPIHTRIPLRERPIANHLGIFANPLNQQHY